MSDKLKEALIKLLRAHLSETRVAGGSIKSSTPAEMLGRGPGLGWSKAEPQDDEAKKTERAKRAIAQKLPSTHHQWLPPTSRALPSYSNDPGVPLRSTPGFMLSPRFAGSMQLLQQLVELPKGSLGHLPHQKIIFSASAAPRTMAPRTVGRLYQTSRSSFGLSVSE